MPEEHKPSARCQSAIQHVDILNRQRLSVNFFEVNVVELGHERINDTLKRIKFLLESLVSRLRTAAGAMS